MKKRIELLQWIRSIEFKFLDSFYRGKYKNNKEVISLLDKYLILENFEPLNIDFRFSFVFKLDDLDGISEEVRMTVYKILYAVAYELSQYTKERYDKFRKHNMLFFMCAFAINKNYEYGVWDDVYKILKKKKWCTGEMGFILDNININNFSFNDEDHNFFIEINQDSTKVFEIAYLILKNFTNNDLMEKACELDLWKDNKGNYLNNKDITDYFLVNKPFFGWLLDN